MLERTYSRYIGDHADSLSRRVMLDLDEPDATNVVGATVTSIGARRA
jgi:hypothetical protein